MRLTMGEHERQALDWLTREWAEYQLDRITALEAENKRLKQKLEIVDAFDTISRREKIDYPMPSVFFSSPLPVQENPAPSADLDDWHFLSLLP